jgi:hypothetical protein
VEPQRTYLAYLPSGESVTVDLRRAAGSFHVQWFHPDSGRSESGGSVSGGSRRELASPFGKEDAVLLLRLDAAEGVTIRPLPLGP